MREFLDQRQCVLVGDVGIHLEFCTICWGATISRSGVEPSAALQMALAVALRLNTRRVLDRHDDHFVGQHSGGDIAAGFYVDVASVHAFTHSIRSQTL